MVGELPQGAVRARGHTSNQTINHEPPMQNILITGATGLIGTATIAHLKNRYNLSALNRRPVTTIPCHRADITDLKAIEPAFKNIDTVIHLAAHIGNDHRAIQHANIQGTTNIFESSLNAGVRRIIFASSGSVVGGYGQHAPYKELLAGDYSAIGETWPMLTHESPLRPTGLYAASKVWGEELARAFADAGHSSVLCLRFGRVNPENRPTQAREYAVWCSHRDAVQSIEKCIEAPLELPFDIFFINSDNKYGYRDLGHARQIVYFVPEDRAEDYR